MHTSVRGGGRGSVQATSSNSKLPDGLLSLDLVAFSPYMRSKGSHDVNAVFAVWILLAFASSAGLHCFGFVSLFFLTFPSDTGEYRPFLTAVGNWA